jgi:hypothetical protein
MARGSAVPCSEIVQTFMSGLLTRGVGLSESGPVYPKKVKKIEVAPLYKLQP